MKFKMLANLWITAVIVFTASLAPLPAAAQQDEPPDELQAPAAGELVLNNTWLLERPDSPKTLKPGGPRMLAVDDGGSLNVAYGGDYLYYAYKSSGGGGWKTEVVDNGLGVGAYATIALDSARFPHIAYYDSVNGNLKYAVQSCDEETCYWSITMVDSSRNDVGLYPSIAVDPAGGVHIAYYDETDTALRYAYKASGGTWEITIAHAEEGRNLGLSPSLALNGFTPCISYLDDTDFSNNKVLFTCSPFSSYEQVATYATNSTALAIGGGYYQIAYQNRYFDAEYGCTFNYNITHAWKPISGGAWDEYEMPLGDYCEDLAFPFRGFSLSLTLDPAGLPWFVYFDHLDDTLQVVRKDSITGGTLSWKPVTDFAVASNIDINNSIGLYENAAHQITTHLVYQIGNWSLNHGWGSANPFTQEVIDTYAPAAGTKSSLVSKNGNPSVAYLQGTGLYYRTRSSLGWSDKGLPVDDHVYEKPALAVGNGPHLVYFQDEFAHQEEISYSYRLCAPVCSWVAAFAITTGAYQTRQMNIAMDSTQKIHTVYKDPTTNKVALRSGSFASWPAQEIIPQIKVETGEYADVAADSENHIHVIYSSDTDQALYYIRKEGAVWFPALPQLIAKPSTIGGVPSGPNDLALYNDFPRAVFYNRTATHCYLMYSEWTSIGWQHSQVVDLGPAYEEGFSLAIGPTGIPYIAYYDPIYKNLMLASKPATTWVFQAIDKSGDVGQQPSLAIDANGLKRISYFDATNGDLKVAMELARVMIPVVLR